MHQVDKHNEMLYEMDTKLPYIKQNLTKSHVDYRCY